MKITPITKDVKEAINSFNRMALILHMSVEQYDMAFDRIFGAFVFQEEWPEIHGFAITSYMALLGAQEREHKAYDGLCTALGITPPWRREDR